MKINAFIKCPGPDKGQNNLILPTLRFTIKQDKADLIPNLSESLITAEREKRDGIYKKQTRSGLRVVFGLGLNLVSLIPDWSAYYYS